MKGKLDPNQVNLSTKYGTHISEATEAENGSVMRNYALIDIDHTMRASWRRDDMLGVASFSWDEYHAAAKDDDPIRDMVALVNALEAFGFMVIAWTGCPERWRQLNMDWLVQAGLQVDDLWMRPDEDFSSNAECKYQIALRKFGSDQGILENVVIVIDDNEELCQKFVEIGVTALQVFARRTF